MTKLSVIIREARKEELGTEVVEGEGLNLAPPAAGEETKITTNAGDAGITVSEESGTGDPLVTIGSGTPIKEIVNAINSGDSGNQQKVPTVHAVDEFVALVVSGLGIPNFQGVVNFNNYLTSNDIIQGSFAAVEDPAGFDFTDSNNRTETGQVRMVCYVSKASGQTAYVSIFISSNDNPEVTGSSISAMLYALEDHNQLTDVRANIIDTIQASLASGLAGKVDTVAGKGLTKHELTDAYKSILDNSPSNINSALSDKMNVTSTGVTQKITNGFLEFENTSAPSNAKRFTFRPTTASRFDLRALNDSGNTVSTFQFKTNGDAVIPGSITQSGNSVVDVTYSKLVNLPNDTNSALAGKVDVDGTKVLSDVNFSTSDKAKLDSLSTTSSFDGGTVNNTVISNSSSSTSPAFVAKRSSNSNDVILIAAQNSGNNYIKSVYVDESDGEKLKISSGSDADITGLTDVFEIDDTLASFNTHIHANGDIFAFNGGNMAANNISSVGKFVGSDYRLDGSESHDYHVLYTATQGNSNSPEGNQAASGKTFSGEATRIRVPNQTTTGFIVENGIGLNLFEINGSTGIVNTANQLTTGGSIFVPRNTRIGRTASSHSTGNNGSVQYGSIVGSTFTGMQIDTTHDGSYNDEVLNFYTHDGGVNAGRRFHIGKDGRSLFQQQLLIGSSSYPSRTLEVIGDARVSTNAEVDGNLDVGGNLSVDGTVTLHDSSNHDHVIESGSDGIQIRSLTNPSSGGQIFGVLSSGGSLRLGVQHDDAVTTSNAEIRVATNSDGTGGHPVLTPNNYGDLRAARTYVQSFPSLSASEIALWFQQGADVEFISVGTGTINLPQIVASNPNSSQVLANSHIYITNSNGSSNIALSRFNSGQTFMIDNIGNLQASATLFFSSRIILKAIDATGISNISTDWAWSMRGV